MKIVRQVQVCENCLWWWLECQ